MKNLHLDVQNSVQCDDMQSQFHVTMLKESVLPIAKLRTVCHANRTVRHEYSMEPLAVAIMFDVVLCHTFNKRTDF